MPDKFPLPNAPENAIPEGGYWNINHVAAFLDVSPHTVKDWHRNARIPEPVHFGRCVRWKIGDIKKWAEAIQEKTRLKTPHVLSIKNASVFPTGRLNGNE